MRLNSEPQRTVVLFIRERYIKTILQALKILTVVTKGTYHYYHNSCNIKIITTFIFSIKTNIVHIDNYNSKLRLQSLSIRFYAFVPFMLKI